MAKGSHDPRLRRKKACLSASSPPSREGFDFGHEWGINSPYPYEMEVMPLEDYIDVSSDDREMEDMPLDDYMDVSNDDHEIEGMLSKDYIDVLSDDSGKDGGKYIVCTLQEGKSHKEISTITAATSE